MVQFYFDETVVLDNSQSHESPEKIHMELLEMSHQARIRIEGATIGFIGDIILTKKQCGKISQSLDEICHRI